MDNHETQAMTAEQAHQALEEFAVASPQPEPSPGLTSEERRSQYVAASGKHIPGPPSDAPPIGPVPLGPSGPAHTVEDISGSWVGIMQKKYAHVQTRKKRQKICYIR